MKSIVPCLWFADNNCAEALRYYVDVFPDARIESIAYYPDASVDEHFEGMDGKVITAVFWLNGQKFIALDGGPLFRFTEAVSFTVECNDQAEIDYYWDKLSHEPEAEQCGWVKDRFGLSWQIVPADIDALLASPAQMEVFMQMKKIDIAALQAAARSQS